MSTELYLDTPDYDSAWELANHFARLISVEWEGREITLKDAEALRDEVERRIIELFESIRPDSQIYNHIAATLAWIGSSPENRLLLEREIDQLIRLPDGRYVGAGWFKKMGKKIGHGISKACDKVGEFWEEHKTAIIIGAVVVTAVVVVVVVATCTGGAGAEAAIAAGCAALDKLANSDTSTPQQQQPSIQQNQIVPEPATIKENLSNPTLIQAPAPTSISLSMDSNPISKPTESTFSQIPSQLQLDLQPFTATSMFQPATPVNPLLPPLKPSSGVPQSVALGDPTNYQTDTRKPAVTHSNPSPVSNYSQDLVFAGPDTFTRVVPIPYENRTSSNLGENLYPKPDFNSFSTPQNNTPTVETVQTDQSTVKASYDKFASKALKGEAFADFQSPPPFGELPIIGLPNQGTIHALGGIANTDESTIEARDTIYEVLGKEFAVQPHRLHSDSLPHGLTMVNLEKISELHEPGTTGCLSSTSCFPTRFLGLDKVPYLISEIPPVAAQVILRNSKIQDSIDYTVEHFTKLANEIIATGNPNLKQVHVPFSNGGHVCKEALIRLTPEQRDTIIIIPVGTTDMIENCWAHKVFNIIGSGDWPSKTCNGWTSNILEKSAKADVKIIPQTETKFPIGGHYFIQPDYQLEIKRVIEEEIKGVYEIY